LHIEYSDVCLTYESVELTAAAELSVGKFLASPQGKLTYPCDDAVIQVAHLTSNSTMTDNSIRIPPRPRFIYLLFMPTWAVTKNMMQRKPLLAWSQFPVNAVTIDITYAGKAILMPHFKNFGIDKVDNDPTMDIFIEYLRSNRIFNGRKNDIFPRDAGICSTLQIFPLDLTCMSSDNIETLSIHMNFGGEVSPSNVEIVCMSLHTTEYTYVNNASTDHKPVWTFIDVTNPPDSRS
jgi:hypothetical protein